MSSVTRAMGVSFGGSSIPPHVFALARHASAAIARIRTLVVTAPRAIGMVLADPAGVVANRARHDGKIGVAAENPSQGGAAQNFGVRTEAAYFSCDDIEEKVVLSFVPRPFTTLIIATEMPAAIRPYSMAVAAVSSFRKALSVRIMPRL